MRKRVLTAVSLLSAVLVWICFVYWGTLNGLFTLSVIETNEPADFLTYAEYEIEQKLNGNIVVSLIEDGQVYKTVSASVGKPVDQNTIFQIASVSKWVTAFGVLKLSEQGLIDLDAPVSTYLTRWQLPDSPYNDSVTIRRILSHSAGFEDGLGYYGFLSKADVQTIEDSLTKAADPAPSRNGMVKAVSEPGTRFSYSGGGYTLLQLLIEEVTGISFNNYMTKEIFQPLGMSATSFLTDGNNHPEAAEFYDSDGNITTYRYFTALAAASLYTTTADLARLMQVNFPENLQGNPEPGILSPENLKMMRTPQTHLLGIPVWGLGTILYTRTEQGDFISGHNGDNHPGISTTLRFDSAAADGIIVFCTGSTDLSDELGELWVEWKTGRPSFLQIISTKTITLFITGPAIMMILLLIVMITKKRFRKYSKTDPCATENNSLFPNKTGVKLEKK